MRILIIGAVAAGTSAATKARRNDEKAEIVIYEKDSDISYSGCGLPYYIGGEIEDIGELTPRDPAFFKKKYNIDIKTRHEVLYIDTALKQISVKNLDTEALFVETYDKLVIATGAVPSKPPIQGIEGENVFFLRNVQSARAIKQFIEVKQPSSAIIVGTGFIGFEMLENLMSEDRTVTIIEKQAQITPNLDEDMASYLESLLIKKKVKIIKNASIIEINQDGILLEDGTNVLGEIVIMATGVKPNVSLAKACGIELGLTGAIKVNINMQTNSPDIYACGDCIELFSSITGKPIYRPLGSTANKTGRIAGDSLTSGSLYYRGTLGTGIFKLFDLTVASTGLTEKEAMNEGYEIVVCHNIKPDKPSYFHGKEMVIKAIADKNTQKLLGIQMIGYQGVDKRMDVFATLITYGAKVDELFHLDLAYAPPFSTTKDPVHYTGMILDNAINRNRPMKTAHQLQQMLDRKEKIQIIDARASEQYEDAHVDEAQNMPHHEIRDSMKELDKALPTVTYCNKGVTGNAVQNILINHGFKDVSNLSGGHKFYEALTNNSDNK